MYTLLVRYDGFKQRSSIHVVDGDGELVKSARTMQDALQWITGMGEFSVTAMTDVGPELFLIEPCEGLQLTLPSYSLRRAFHGRCCDPPPLPGLEPDPTPKPRTQGREREAAIEAKRRRANWLRRATGPAADDAPR